MLIALYYSVFGWSKETFNDSEMIYDKSTGEKLSGSRKGYMGRYEAPKLRKG
jgi:hypothetical protein